MPTKKPTPTKKKKPATFPAPRDVAEFATPVAPTVDGAHDARGLQANPKPIPKMRPTPRDLADRATLRLLRLRGVALSNVQQAQAIDATDEPGPNDRGTAGSYARVSAESAAWAYLEGLDAIALERQAGRLELDEAKEGAS